MDDINQIGKYLKEAGRTADLAIKRVIEPSESVEKIRDVFDPEIPFQANVNIPYNASRVMLDLNFAPRLPSIGCCGDCVCGVTESYTSDSLIDGKIYTVNPYISNSTLVYLDGLRVTKGIEYTESSPLDGQIWIHVPFSTITISYQYTTGNCTDNPCIDTGPCLDFAIFSNLATVFADRFDRGVPENGGYTAGGCGVWRTSLFTMATPTMFSSGQGSSFINNWYAPFGGSAMWVSGKTIEGVGIIDGGEFDISLVTDAEDGGAGYAMTEISPTQIQLQVSGSFIYWEQDLIPSWNTQTQSKQQTFTVPAGFIDGRIAYRIAAYPTGEKYMRVWAFDEPESASIQLTLSLSDFDESLTDSPYSDLRMVSATYYAAVVYGNHMFIKFGAGLDKGDWTTDAAGTDYGRHLQICRLVPDYSPGNPYFGDCGVDQTTQSPSMGSVADYHVTVTWPIFIGGPTPEGSARVGEILQTLGTCGMSKGTPSGYVIRGKVRVSFAASDIPVSVIFEDYPGAGDIPYSANGFAGGLQLGAISTSTNADYIPFQYSVRSVNGRGRWGVYIPNVDSLVPTFEFIPPSITFAPDYGLSVDIIGYEVEALENVQCTAGEICGLCDDSRCPEIVDSFTENYPSFLTPSSVEFSRNTPQGILAEVTQDDGVRFQSTAGVGKVTWEGLLADSFSALYLHYPNSPLECRSGVEDDYFASFEFKVATLTPVGNYTEIGWGGWSAGMQALVWIQSGVLHGEAGNFGVMPASFSAGQWVTAEYKTEGTWTYARVYPTGGTPTAWTGQEDATLEGFNSPRLFTLWLGNQQTNSASTQEIEVRNVTIRRV